MAESGGPTTHSGIYYQNTISALFLGRLVDLRDIEIGHRVVGIQLESTDNIDDLVIQFADGTTAYSQIKLNLKASGSAWKRLWESFADQIASSKIREDDRFELILGTASELANILHECCARAKYSKSAGEFDERITQQQKKIVNSIKKSISSRSCNDGDIFRILQKTTIQVIEEAKIDRSYLSHYVPESSIPVEELFAKLRDIASESARFRVAFKPSQLRDRLKKEFDVNVAEPVGWGANNYRSVIISKAEVNIPGTSITKNSKPNFPWPKAARYEKSELPDFDDESINYSNDIDSDQIDLSLFPSVGMERLIVIAGPGFGKSVLTRVLAGKLAEEGYLPVIISIPLLSNLGVNIYDYLVNYVNSTFSVSINWLKAAETGSLVLLFDGLDEVATYKRTLILEEIRNFELRYVDVPWLLTVRDASALATSSTSVLKVELLALSKSDIDRYIYFYCPERKDLPAKLTKQFITHPEVFRLAKIPLFLAIILATIGESSDVPKNRSHLLEVYLDLLFKPEQFKVGENDNVDPTVLRPIAEAVAFEALEREEIGIRSINLEQQIKAEINDLKITPIIERLSKCGVLTKKSPGLYEFPFPIVQEYLAANYILNKQPSSILDRLSFISKRPWAQAIQFVLENIGSSATIVNEILSRPDDAFYTNLRLVARCVANGMQINPKNKLEVAKRLSIAWPTASWNNRMKIGELLVDAFCIPMIPELREQISKRFLLNDGGAQIVSKINDQDLTRIVLKELLAGDIEHLYHLHEMQPLVSLLGDEALQLYITKLHENDCSDATLDSLSSLISQLDGNLISSHLKSSLIKNIELPLKIRMALLSLSQNPFSTEELELVNDAIVDGHYSCLSRAIKILINNPSPLDSILKLLQRNDLPIETLCNVLDYITQGDTIESIPKVFEIIAENADIPLVVRNRAQVYAARYGNEQAMATLVAQFENHSFEIVSATLSIFGYHQSKKLAQIAVELLSKRAFDPQERVFLASSIRTGIIYFFEMGSFRSGALKPAPKHIGFDIFMSILETWAREKDYSPLQEVSINDYLASLGNESALTSLFSLIPRVLNDSSIDLEKSNNSHIVGSGLRLLQEKHKLFSLEFLESIVAKSTFNTSLAAVYMIATHGNLAALNSLLKIHNEAVDTFFRKTITDSIETLSSRLGCTISRIDSKLVLSQ